MNNEDDGTDYKKVAPVIGETLGAVTIFSLLQNLWLNKMMLVKNLLRV